MIPLAVEDARILALETGPIRGHTLKVLVIDDAPGEAVVDALRAEIAQRLPSVPRWRQRIVPATESPTGLAWQDDRELDVARHVRAVSGAAPVGDAQLRKIVAESLKAPLDRERPLWTMEVVPRLSDGRWAIVWKVHHALADGMTAMRAGAQLLWTEASSQAGRGPKAASAAPSQPRGRFAELVRHRGLVIREFRRVRIWALSPLAADVGTDRVVAFTRCTLDELRTAGKAIAPDVTINDVLLAVVAGALRRWLESQKARRSKLKVQVPVSMHPSVAEASGNRDSFLLLDLPIRERDPVDRVRAVSHATRLRKNRHDAQAIDALRSLVGRAPARVRGMLQRLVQGPHEYSLNVSNVPGPTGPIHVLGHHVDAIFPLAEIAPHHALRVAALSLEGSLFIGLSADPRVVPDLDVLADGIGIAIEELHARLAA